MSRIDGESDARREKFSLQFYCPKQTFSYVGKFVQRLPCGAQQFGRVEDYETHFRECPTTTSSSKGIFYGKNEKLLLLTHEGRKFELLKNLKRQLRHLNFFFVVFNSMKKKICPNLPLKRSWNKIDIHLLAQEICIFVLYARWKFFSKDNKDEQC